MVIGLAECQLEPHRVLKREPAAVAVAAEPGAKRKFKYHPEIPYLTWSGKEESGVLISVRDQAGCALEMLDFERTSRGCTKRKTYSNIWKHCILSHHHREGNLAAQRGLPRKNKAPRHGGAHAQRSRQ